MIRTPAQSSELRAVVRPTRQSDMTLVHEHALMLALLLAELAAIAGVIWWREKR